MRTDPLHVSYEELVVYFEGKAMFMLNKVLLDKQVCWENLNKIKEKHVERLYLEKEMENTDDRDLLKLFDALYDLIECELQELWKFDLDRNFHVFWKRPKCSCPKLDNNDRYPTGFYIKSVLCPLHGDF